MTTAAWTIREVSVAEMRRDSTDLLRQHWAEIEQNRLGDALDPDWERAEQMEREGKAFWLGVEAAEADAAVVGHCYVAVGTHIFYRSVPVAICQAVYVLPDWRRAGIGQALLAAANDRAAELGAKRIVYAPKVATRLEALLAHSGYTLRETVYTRELR